MPSEAGYDELRRVFVSYTIPVSCVGCICLCARQCTYLGTQDFLRERGQVGPALAGQHDALKDGEVSITVMWVDFAPQLTFLVDSRDEISQLCSYMCFKIQIPKVPSTLI